MKSNYNTKLQNFSTLSLTELNAKASYLKRIDKKYLLNWSQFAEILDELKEDFLVLEIKWQKIFSYDKIVINKFKKVIYDWYNYEFSYGKIKKW